MTDTATAGVRFWRCPSCRRLHSALPRQTVPQALQAHRADHPECCPRGVQGTPVVAGSPREV